jgi:arylsulfatase A-like enzyme
VTDGLSPRAALSGAHTAPPENSPVVRWGLAIIGQWAYTAVWFALATASVHLLLVLWTRYVRNELTWTGREFLWMAPVSYFLLFEAIAVPAAILAVLFPVLRRPRVMVASMAWVSVFGALLLLAPRVHPAALALLALGAVVRLASLMRSPHRVRLAKGLKILVVPAVMIGVYGGAEQLTRQWREERALARLPAPPANAPNVLLVVLDAVRAANLSVYGYPLPTTPSLERLAREGVLFEWAFSTAPWSLPSHASIFTGRLPDELHADWKIPYIDSFPTLAQIMRGQGYATTSFTGNFMYVTTETGLARGFVHADDYELSLAEILRSNVFAQTESGSALINVPSVWMFFAVLSWPNLRQRAWPDHVRRTAPTMVDRFLDWQRRSHGRPFFAFINLFDAHQPYQVSPARSAEFYRGPGTEQVAEYDAAIAQMDHEVGRLVDSLSARGILDHTLLIITSDHGHLLGEHGLRFHANSLYLNVLRVPLIIRFPGGVPASMHIQNVSSLLDLPNTIQHLSGSGNAIIPGRSLSRFWSRDSAFLGALDHTAVAQVSVLASASEGPVRFGPIDALIDDHWHYIEGPGWNRELYDYHEDSTETRNLALDSAYADTMLALSHQLRLLAPHSAPLRR